MRKVAEKRCLKQIYAAALMIVFFVGTMLAPTFAQSVDEIEEENSSEIAAENDILGIAANAKSAVLMERETGQILYRSRADERLSIASVTKIMTLLILAEEMSAGRVHFEDIAVASPYASSMDGSVIWLNPNEQMSVFDLTRSVVIASANDACVCLAEHISGSEAAFVERMNSRAAELGMTNTHFSNCVGYDDMNHYSTAEDVAIMAAALRKYDYFDEFLLTRLTYVREDTERATQLLNTNKLINSYEGITGLKTGTTDGAGYCLVATAERGGMELVAVVLGAAEDEVRFSSAATLLDYGFSGFELYKAQFDYEQLSEIAVERGVAKSAAIKPVTIPQCLIEKGSSSKIEYHTEIAEMLTAPVNKGDVVGKISAVLEGKTLFTAEIAVTENIEELTFFKSFSLIIEQLFHM